MAAVFGSGAKQACIRTFEIKIVHFVGARLDSFNPARRQNTSLVLASRDGAAIGYGFVIRILRVTAHGIHQLELMFDGSAFIHLLDELINPFLLHEAAYKMYVVCRVI